MIAEIVHDIVNNSNDFLLNVLASNNSRLIKGYIPKDKSLGFMASRANEYAFRRPQNPFISEQQVKDICLLYGLKLGGMFAFTGEIPDKNQLEIDNYKRENDNYLIRKSISDNLGGFSVDDIFKFIRKNPGGYRNFEYDSYGKISLRGATEGNAVQGKLILPLTENIALQFKRYRNDFKSSLILQGDNYQSLVYNDIGTAHINMYEGWALGHKAHTLRVVHEFDLQIDLQSLEHTILNDKPDYVDYKVIAPGELFNTTALKEFDGYRYKLDSLSFVLSSIFIDDPIVLEPVEGGYLVVSKWGGESDLIDNPKSN